MGTEPEIREIRLGDLPGSLIDTVKFDVWQYGVAFVRAEDSKNGRTNDLLGSGVFVSAGGVRAILTAHHVLAKLEGQRRLGLFMEPTTTPHTIDAEGVDLLKIDRGPEERLGPDLGAVILAPSIAGSIASKKTFYNIDRRREAMLEGPRDVRDGFWMAQGFLDERGVVTPNTTGQGFTKYFYNFSGIGRPEAEVLRDGYDFVDFLVSEKGRDGAPERWGGMSGCGLWHVLFHRRGDTFEHQTPTLSGIVFYQHPTTDTQCGIVGHARRSVYERAYEAIRNTASSRSR